MPARFPIKAELAEAPVYAEYEEETIDAVMEFFPCTDGFQTQVTVLDVVDLFLQLEITLPFA